MLQPQLEMLAPIMQPQLEMLAPIMQPQQRCLHPSWGQETVCIMHLYRPECPPGNRAGGVGVVQRTMAITSQLGSAGKTEMTQILETSKHLECKSVCMIIIQIEGLSIRRACLQPSKQTNSNTKEKGGGGAKCVCILCMTTSAPMTTVLPV